MDWKVRKKLRVLRKSFLPEKRRNHFPEVKVRAEEEKVVGPAHKQSCHLLSVPTCGRTRDGEPIHRT